MKKITVNFLNHRNNGCLILGLSMGTFTGSLTAITSGNKCLLLIGIVLGLVFAMITQSVKDKSLRQEIR